MIFKKFTLLLLLVTTWLSFASCSLFSTNREGGERKSIYDLLTIDKRFTKFLQHIEDTGAVDEFKSIKKGTVFAPVNEAFDGEKLIMYRNLEKEQVLYHLIPVSIKSGELYDGELLETEAKLHNITQMLKVKNSFKGDISVGTDSGQEESHVIEADMDASNGVIHLVGKVLSLPNYVGKSFYIL